MTKVGEHITLDILGATKDHDSKFFEKLVYKTRKILPYNKNLVTRSIKNILKKNLINKNSILVIEEERKSKEILIPELKIERVKELGISKFSFYRLT